MAHMLWATSRIQLNAVLVGQALRLPRLRMAAGAVAL